MRLTRRSFITTAALAGGSLLLAACGSDSGSMGSMPGMNHGSMGTATPAASAPGMPGMGGMAGLATPAEAVAFDQMFIDMMVPHHQAAIDMAKVARTKAQHAELKTLADAIVADQDGEIAQMKAWRKAWYGSDQIAPGMGSHQMSGMGADLNALSNANPFDRAFIDAMIPHHQSAIDMAEEAQQKAQHPEIKQLAGNIIAAQQREIDQMKAWRAQWYPG